MFLGREREVLSLEQMLKHPKGAKSPVALSSAGKIEMVYCRAWVAFFDSEVLTSFFVGVPNAPEVPIRPEGSGKSRFESDS